MITLIDLSKLTNDEIVAYAKSNGLTAKAFLRNKENGVTKIWFIAQEDSIVTVSYMKDGKITYTDQFSKYLNDMDFYKPEEVEPVVYLTIDDVLDKISQVGIDNISEAERTFLRNASK